VGGRALVASAMAAASSGVTGDSEVGAAILFDSTIILMITMNLCIAATASLLSSGEASQPLILINGCDNWGKLEK